MEQPKTINDYEIIKGIGKGSYGRVYKAIRKSDGRLIALKVIDVDKNDKSLIDETLKEVEYLKRISFPECNTFIICYYDSYYDKKNGKFLIEMEYVEGRDMESFVKELKNKRYSDAQINYYLLLIAKDLAQGLKYIHKKGIIHNDIKLENIMIDNNNIPRIIDFGLACFAQPDKYIGPNCNSMGGTPYYTAPEFLTVRKRFPSSDMWALGIVLFMAAKGHNPFGNKKDTLQGFYNKLRTMKIPEPNTSNNQLNTLIDNLLVRDYDSRWNADQVLNHLHQIEKPSEMINNNYQINNYQIDNYQMDQIDKFYDMNSIEKEVVVNVPKITEYEDLDSANYGIPSFQQPKKFDWNNSSTELKSSLVYILL